MVYRVFRNDRKLYVKILHGSLLFFSIIFMAVGLKAVFDSHNLANPPVSNMYSLHSWLGLATIILFICQVTSYQINANEQILSHGKRFPIIIIMT